MRKINVFYKQAEQRTIIEDCSYIWVASHPFLELEEEVEQKKLRSQVVCGDRQRTLDSLLSETK